MKNHTNVFKMNKEDFIKIITDIEEQRKKDLHYCDVLSELLHPYIEPYDNSLLENVIFALLDVIYPGHKETIEYFIYDLEFGKDYAFGKMTIEDENIDLSSSEKLWEYLETYK